MRKDKGGKNSLETHVALSDTFFLNNVFILFSNVDNGDDITVRTPTKMVTVKFYFLHIIIRLYISKIKKKNQILLR